MRNLAHHFVVCALLLSATMCYSDCARAADEKMQVTVGSAGQVEVRVNGELCLRDFKVLIAGPGWKHGYALAKCERKEALTEGRQQVTVTGRITREAEEYGSVRSVVEWDEGRVTCRYEVRVQRDCEVETIRLNGQLPIEVSAGKAAWYIFRPEKIRAALFPERLHDAPDPGDSGFEWFGWILTGGSGIRFVPNWQGIQGMTLQDGRQWGGKDFQVCWTIVPKGTVRAGEILQCEMKIELLSSEQVVKPAFKQGLSLLSVCVALEPSPAGENLRANVKVRNLAALQRNVDVRAAFADDVFAQLGGLTETGMSLPPMGQVAKEMPVKATSRGDYRMDVQVLDPQNNVSETLTRRLRLDRTSGLRNEISLNGEWDFLPVLEGELTYPPKGDWQKKIVPSSLDARAVQNNGCWYRRQFEAPRSMEGKRIKVRFAAVNFDAKVFVNGKLAGAHFGGFLPFLVDVTDLVKIGEPNELCVAVRCWTAACLLPVAPFEVKPLEHPHRYLPPNSMIAPFSSWFLLTGIYQDVSLLAYPKVYVEDVFVQTSMRRKEIRAEISVRNEDTTAHTLELSNSIFDRDGLSKRLKTESVSVGAGKVQRVTIADGWTDPKLWSIEQPHLYRLETALEEGGKRVDERSTRFGFREVWTQGTKFLLNGVPMTLFATSTGSHARWEEAVETIQHAKQANCRAMRLHTQPMAEHNLDAADELGLLIIDESAVYCRYDKYATQDERFWENYASHVRELALRDRNHPSLIMYSLENEILACGAKWEIWEKRLADLSDVVRSVDPTRPIMYESDLDPGGKADVIGLHYPKEYWKGDTLYPQKSYWMDEETKTCNVLWKWKRDKPLYIGEFDGGFVAWYPQYQSFWAGEEVYAEKQIPYRTSPINAQARKETLVQDIAAYRTYEVTGMCPWVFGDELQRVGEMAFVPLFVSIREQTRNFYAGDTIHRTLSVHNDLFKAANPTLKWQVALGQKTIQAGEFVPYLQPTEQRPLQIEFKAPRVERKTSLVFSARLYHDGEVAFETEQPLTVFPRLGSFSSLASVGSFALFDKVGRTQSILDRLKVNYRRIGTLTEPLPADVKALVIGYRSLTDDAAAQAPRLAEFVANGGTIICFEQEKQPRGWLPLEAELDSAHACTMAFPRVPAHAILKEIARDDLRFWQPDYLVAEGSFLKPTKGSCRALVDAGGIRGSINDMNGLNWSPLLEIIHGKGSYILCQLDVTTKFGSEPMAERLILNMLEHATKAPANTYVRVGVIAEANSTFERMLDSVSLAYDSLLGRLSRADLSSYGLIIIGASDQVWNEVEQSRQKLRDFVKSGGVVWLHNLRPEQAAAVKDLLEMDFALTPLRDEPLWKACEDPVMAGLSNHELYWRERPVWDMWAPYRRIAEYAFSTAQPNSRVKPLTEPSALAKIESGKGFFLIDQLLWDVEEKNHREGFKILSNLLTDLHAKLDLSPFKRVNLSDYFQVDLKLYCNLGFKGEVGKGGWMGHGEDAMREFGPGLKILHGIPFQITDEVKNGGKSCIVLAGKHKPHFPKEVKAIKVSQQARKLYFLHTCAWGGKEGVPAARYTIHYQDGTQLEIPVRTNLETRDWYAEPASISFAELAWKGSYRGANPDGMAPDLVAKKKIGVYCFEWTNPHPEKRIEAMDFASAENDPIPVLIAVTGSHSPP